MITDLFGFVLGIYENYCPTFYYSKNLSSYPSSQLDVSSPASGIGFVLTRGRKECLLHISVHRFQYLIDQMYLEI